MAENSSFLQTTVPKFDGYYEHWSMLMENLLQSKEYWPLIETGVTVAPPNATAEQQCIANESKLCDLKVKRAQLQALRREFEILEMQENKSMNDYFSRTLAIANRMTAQGETMEQLTIVEKIFRTLTPKFNYVACSIEESNDVNTLTVEGLQSSLVVQEQRMCGQQKSSEEQALKISNGGRGSNNSRGKGRSSIRGRGRGRQNLETIECHKCHKLGHYQSACLNWGDNVNYTEFYEEEETLIMARTEKDQEIRDEIWYLDSGCSNHMIGNKDWLFEFDSSFKDSVKLGNDTKMSVMGKGNVKLFINGKSWETWKEDALIA
ncbi:retrovirus-related Pol polyprotein from transposon TNT 1-94 [Trifolium medium]|uniref:Retrovirus-related Pol polyprotein from transposon TNT 1-94 n=1 Tax=Trifolium medium TaxID=97028 RepID=A0A392M9B3_9FABA|nr:retrovirus-related Pol polyprotein from transposon TNT 1-94 [Trifolium medium]